MKQPTALAIMLLALPYEAQATHTITGKVVGVTDGDIITVLYRRRKPIKIRLHGIDTPEKAQPFGQKAKQFTSKLVFGKQVRVKVVARDRYGRTVGEVFFGDKSLNTELVRAGLAWWYRQHARRTRSSHPAAGRSRQHSDHDGEHAFVACHT